MRQRARILIIGYRKYSELIAAIIPEYEEQAEIRIVESVASRSVDYEALVREHHPDVVASAGSNVAYLRNTLKLPVIGQPVTETDVVEAVARARRIGRRVVLFVYAGQGEISDRLFAALPGIGGGDLHHEKYSTTDEAREKLLALTTNNDVDVVVGPSYICNLAERQGIPTALIYSKESARQMLDEGLRRARASAQDASEESRPFVIHSPQLSSVAQRARIYARGSAAVLLQGESGTGKEHIAKEIHQQSDYRQGALVAVNCGSIPNELFESELFGYVDGAFTSSRRGGRVGLVEQANGGVLFLDEVGEMPMAQQVKLLRVLQERRVRPVGSNREVELDFKLIAATNADLRDDVERGSFRDDLFYRLNVFNLHIPPLRDRREDIEGIALHYLSQYARDYAVQAQAGELLGLLADSFQAYSWPGNVRELQNFCERLIVNLAGGVTIGTDTLPQLLPELFSDDRKIGGALKEQEYQAIEAAMLRLGGDKTAVSRELGISATTLWRRLKEMDWDSSSLTEKHRETNSNYRLQK